MKKLTHIFTFLFLLGITANAQIIIKRHIEAPELKAFPTAEGFGKNATGGRGGTVLKVTNLNASGAGSLRAAMEASGTRTVVFEVGGTIDLAGTDITVDEGNLTVAGQTAPGDGILIKGGMVSIEASNVILRYLRVRVGTGAAAGRDALQIVSFDSNNIENIIVDHCSFSWALDENIDIRGASTGIAQNITIQNSISSECNYGTLLNTKCKNISILNNLYALNYERNIRANEPIDGEFEFEMVNNVVYGFINATKPSLGVKFSVINNEYKKSSGVTINDVGCVDGTTSGQGTPASTYAYVTGNIVPSGMVELAADLTPYQEVTPFSGSDYTPIIATDLDTELIPYVGCSFPSRDAVDTRIIANYTAGDGTLATTGTYPTISGGSAPTDLDNDGMADSWETSNFGDLTRDGTGDFDGDGYTDLEEYINSLII